MIIPEQPFVIPRLHQQAVFYSIMAIGTCTLIALAFVALLSLAYFISLVLQSVYTLCAACLVLYQRADSLEQLIMLVVLGVILYRVGKAIVARRHV